MKKREITLSQSNLLTQAKYDFTKVEKRAVYFIIQEVRRQFVENQNGQKDLFDDLVVQMDTSKLQGTETELREIYKSLKSLRRKSIWIEDDERVLEVGYINYFEHYKHSKSLEVQVSKKNTALPGPPCRAIYKLQFNCGDSLEKQVFTALL